MHQWDPFAADAWGCGLVLFILLFGFPPFELPSNVDGRFKYLMEGKYVIFILVEFVTLNSLPTYSRIL